MLDGQLLLSPLQLIKLTLTLLQLCLQLLFNTMGGEFISTGLDPNTQMVKDRILFTMTKHHRIFSTGAAFILVMDKQLWYKDNQNSEKVENFD